MNKHTILLDDHVSYFYLGCLVMAIDYLFLLCWVGSSLGSKVDEHNCILAVCLLLAWSVYS